MAIFCTLAIGYSVYLNSVHVLYCLAISIFSFIFLQIVFKSIRYYNFASTYITLCIFTLTLSRSSSLTLISLTIFIFFLINFFYLSKKKIYINRAILLRTIYSFLETIFSSINYSNIDIITSPTFLLKESGKSLFQPLNLILGNSSNSYNELGVLFFAISAIFIFRKLSKYDISIIYLIGVIVFHSLLGKTALIHSHSPWLVNPFYFAFSSPILFTAIFILTDPKSTPNSKSINLFFALTIALLSVISNIYFSNMFLDYYGLLIFSFVFFKKYQSRVNSNDLKNQYISIRPNLCKNCFRCINVCPHHAIIKNHSNHKLILTNLLIIKSYCCNCNLCVTSCPTKALNPNKY